jgi:hypothetical protein
MQAGVPVWAAAGYLGMSVEVLLSTTTPIICGKRRMRLAAIQPRKTFQ